VDDEGAPDGAGRRVEERGRAAGQGHAVGRGIEMRDPILVDDEVRQVAGGGEGRGAGTDRVDVDAVQARGQALDVDVDVDDPGAVLDQTGRADGRARRIDDGRAGLGRAAGVGLDGEGAGEGQRRPEDAGRDEDSTDA